MPPAEPAAHAPRGVPLWRNADYMLLWSGQVVSTLGSTASTIIYPLLILALTGSPRDAGVAGALRALPYLVLSLPVGALVDRWDRKRVMILCDVGRAIAVASIPAAMAFDALTLAQVYAVSLLEGSLYVFFNIAEVAALPRVVPAAQLPEAAAQNEAGFGAANIVGPSFGAFLYQAFGRGVPFLVDAITYAVSVLSLLRIRTSFASAATRRGERASAHRDLRAEVAEGLAWLWGNPLIRFMALITGGINLVAAASPLVLIVLAKELGAHDAEIGVIFSVAGVGGILGSLVGGQVQRRFAFGTVIVALMWGEALLFPLYAAAPSWPLLGAIGALTFFLSPIYNVVQFSYRLALIPDRLQGRVNSTFRLVCFGLMPVGAALSGVLLERFGTGATIAVFSAWLAALAVLTTLNRHVRNAPPLAKAMRA
jgi:predicted MFS family arabinose efflux permease